MAKPEKTPSARTRASRAFKGAQRSLGLRIRELRTLRDLTLEGLAERSDVDWKHIQKVESGALNLTLATLFRLARGLDVELVDLFEGAGTEPRPRT